MQGTIESAQNEVEGVTARRRTGELLGYHFPELDASTNVALMRRQFVEITSAGNLINGVIMPAYMIVNLDVADPAACEEYKAKAPALIKKHGGKYIVRGGKFTVL